MFNRKNSGVNSRQPEKAALRVFEWKNNGVNVVLQDKPRR